MGVIEETYADIETDVSEEEFREAVGEKVEQMAGLADEETAAMLLAHELDGGEVEGIADLEAGMEEAKFLGKVGRIGDLRTFERDGEDEDGRVINIDVADETGSVRIALWDEQASAAEADLQTGDVLRIKGRPKDGYNGLEVSVDQIEIDEDAEIDVPEEDDTIGGLVLGRSDVTVDGLVLDTGTVRTFDRDDGSEGRVANLIIGDATGRIRITLWGEKADRVTDLAAGESVSVIDGYVRERNGDLEVHVGSRGAIEPIDERVEYVPEPTAIADLEIEQVVDIAGVVRSADPKRTFDRDDGSEGQVRNVRIQDASGDIRVALWGEKADRDIGPGDEVQFTDVEIQDGWQDDLEASAGWRSSVTPVPASHDVGASSEASGETDTASSESEAAAGGLAAFTDEGERPKTGGERSAQSEETADAESTDGTEEVTGTVVQPGTEGSPAVLDTDDRTVRFTDEKGVVGLGERVTVRLRAAEGGFALEEVLQNGD
jgi:replication factor A1